MTCYCANYYASINCQNTVTKFGDRCNHCSGSRGSSSSSIPRASEQWVENAKREELRRQESYERRQRVHQAIR